MTELATPPVEQGAAVKRISHWIGGRSVEGKSGRSGPVYNPATGDVLAHVAEGDKEDIHRAVVAARRGVGRLLYDRFVKECQASGCVRMKAITAGVLSDVGARAFATTWLTYHSVPIIKARIALNMSPPIDVVTSIEIVGETPASINLSVARGPCPMCCSTSGAIEALPPVSAMRRNSLS